MLAAVFHETGDPAAVLQVADAPPPRPAAGQVLVDVDHSVVQPADLMFIGGRYRTRPQLPQVAGLEGTGIVAASDGQLQPGQRVAFRHPGAWAEQVAVPEAACYVVPEHVSIDAAAQFSLNPVTAWALLDEAGARSSDWLVVSAARSAIARLVTKLADLRCIRVVGLVRTDAKGPTELPTGATEGEALTAGLLTLSGGTAFEAFIDSVGGAIVPAVLSALRPGATIVSYGVLDDAPVGIRNSDLIYRNLTWKGFGIDHWLANSRHRRAEMSHELWRLIGSGDLELPVEARFPLASVGAAIGAATGPGAGKVLLDITSTRPA